MGWGTWSSNWAWSLLLVAATIATHVAGVVLIGIAIERMRARVQQSTAGIIVAIVGVALWLACLHAAESMVWAVAYLRLGAFSTPADAVLYSLDSMTTRGASGLVPSAEWRMMGAAEAGDGMLLFGISTAFLFYVMIRLLKHDYQFRG
jgi:cobalamin biosynthesis protein CobD/CbiB